MSFHHSVMQRSSIDFVAQIARVGAIGFLGIAGDILLRLI
jgi:hypothetical protein